MGISLQTDDRKLIWHNKALSHNNLRNMTLIAW